MDHHHGLLADGQIVQRLIDHAAGGRAVADQGYHIVILPQKGSGPGHAQGNGHGAGGMARHEGIGLALLRLGKAGYSAELAQRSKRLLPPRQKLVDIGLVPHVKDQPVHPGIINGLDGYGKLDNAQVPRQVAAGFGDTLYQKFPDLPAKAGFLRL